MGDYEYLKYEPHSFGACKEQNFTAKVKSSIWKEEEQRVTILGRKEGDEYKIYIPKILGACKVNEVADCTLTVDLSEFIDIFFDLNYTFAASMVIYDMTFRTEYSFPAAAKLRNAKDKTFLDFLPSKGILPNDNLISIESEALFGIMGMTITINFNLFDMCTDVKEDYEESDEEEDDDIMTDDNESNEEEGSGGGDNESNEPGEEEGGGSGEGDNPSGDDDDFIGDDGYDSDDFINDDNYTGFLPASVSEINKLATTYSLPTNMILKKVRWLVSCKAWGDEKFYVVGLAGVDNLESPKRGVIVVPDLYRNIGYSNTCEGSEIIISGGYDLAVFFKNIADGILDEPNFKYYEPKNYDSCMNFAYNSVIAYYYDNSFRITPNTDTYKYFYPLTNRLIKQQKIGYYGTAYKLYFKFSQDTEGYDNHTNLRANDPTLLDPSTIRGLIDSISYRLNYKMESNVFDASVTRSFSCFRTPTTGTIMIQELYAPIKRTDGYKKDVVRITFDENFYDFYGGYLPCGQLGTCTLLHYNMLDNTTNEINGIVYFYGGALNVVPRDEKYSNLKEWYSKDEDESGQDSAIGIINMQFDFEIQKTEPIYVDLNDINAVDENGIPYSWIRKSIQVKATCWSWNEIPHTTNIFIAKNAERPSEGVIIIPPLMYEIAYQGSFHGYEIAIDDSNQMMDFFGKVPSPIISEDGVAYGYFPMRYDTCYNYKTEKAFLYYYNGGFYIGIRNDTYNCFYPLVNELIKPRKIGIKDKWVIRFKVPETAEYGDANNGSKEIPNEVLDTMDKFLNRDYIDGTIKVTMDSEVINEPIVGEMAFSFIEGDVILAINDFYQSIRVTPLHFPGKLYLRFDDSFGDIFGGYFPAGVLGDCSLRVYDIKKMIYMNLVGGIVYYYNNALNIVCDNDSITTLNTQVEEELQGNGADYIGIHNLELRFKIQKTEPSYDYLANGADFIGYVPASITEVNTFLSYCGLPNTWNIRKIRCLAYCKAWEDKKYPVYGIVGVDNLNAPSKGVFVFSDLKHSIAYSGTCEGSEIIIKENGLLAEFFKNIPDGKLFNPMITFYDPKDYYPEDNYIDEWGIIYYYDNSFRITPDDRYKYFFPLTNSLIEQQNIGCDAIFSQQFDISLDNIVLPENRTNLRAGVPTTIEEDDVDMPEGGTEGGSAGGNEGGNEGGDVPEGGGTGGDVPEGGGTGGDVPEGGGATIGGGATEGGDIDMPEGGGAGGDVPEGGGTGGDVPEGGGTGGDVPEGGGTGGDVPEGDVPEGGGAGGDVPEEKYLTLDFTLESDILEESVTTSVTCYKVSNYGKISINDFYGKMKLTQNAIHDTLKLTFSENINNFFGGYFPSGKLGTCTVYDEGTVNISNLSKNFNGLVYFYNDTLNIIPDDENYPETKYWVAKLESLICKIGIVSMTIEFEIQETKPVYKDLSSEIFIPPGGGDISINRFLDFKLESDIILNGNISSSVKCYKSGGEGSIEIKNFLHEITNTKTMKQDVLKLTFNDDFYDFYGGYLPSGQLGTCIILALNDMTNTIGKYNGIAYFYNDAINIIPNDKRYPSNIYWYGKSMDGNPEIGIVSMTIQFEIQETKPDYVDLK